MREIRVYTDGGARGNPGPAAAAFVVIGDGRLLHQDARYLGKKTNNEAEYAAVLMALKWLNKNKKTDQGESVIFFIDSELVVKQLNGAYKTKSKNLKPLIAMVELLVKNLGCQARFVFVRRENNKLADRLVNLELDKSRQK